MVERSWATAEGAERLPCAVAVGAEQLTRPALAGCQPRPRSLHRCLVSPALWVGVRDTLSLLFRWGKWRFGDVR